MWGRDFARGGPIGQYDAEVSLRSLRTRGHKLSAALLLGSFAILALLAYRFSELRECKRYDEMELRLLVLEEVSERGLIINYDRNASPSLAEEGVWSMQVHENFPDGSRGSEYDQTKYEVQASYPEVEFWALIDTCGTINMAGRGRFSR